MNRRQFFKTVAAAATATVVAPAVVRGGEKPTPLKLRPPQKFWMQTYGPMYNPNDQDWSAGTSKLCGVHAGSTIASLNAGNYNLGDRLVLANGVEYRCAAMHEDYYIEGHGNCSIDYYRKGDLLYYENPQTKTS